METKYRLQMIQALCQDAENSLSQETIDLSQKFIHEKQKVTNYRRTILNKLPKLLSDDFGIPLNQIPSELYLQKICDICEDTN